VRRTIIGWRRFSAVTTRRRYLSARFAYVAIVLLATLTRLDLSPNLADASVRLQRAFVPSLGWRDAIDGLRNLVLFAGLGAVWVMTSLTGKVSRELRMATLTAFALSVVVEAVQVFSPVRMASIIDVTTDTLGGLAGAIVTTLLLIALRNARTRRSYLGIPVLLVAGPYAVAVLCEALSPLFSEATRGADGGPLTRLAFELQSSLPLAWDQFDVFDIPLFAAAGALLLVLVRERRGAAQHQWIGVAAFGSLTIAAAHVAHGFVSLPVRWEAVILDAVSIALGAWVADRWLAPFTQHARGAARARVVIATYIGLLVLWGWRPLVPKTHWDAIVVELDPSAFMPLSGLGDRVDLFSALHVAQQFLLYLPLGALLAKWPLRVSGPWSHLWPAVVMAVVIELGHIVVADRTFDVTNALITCAGLAMGWTAVRRSGYLPAPKTG
jgi:glycopeptide antibiotics resistance protein